MSRVPRRVWVAFASAGLCASAPQAPAQSPDPPERTLEAFLEEEGLRTLLARRLEQRLDEAVGSERQELAERLASIYVDLIESAETDEERRRLEARSRTLLERAPNADSFDLRLSLSRAAYARAERLAERWRIRAEDAGARVEALRSFRELAPRLAQVGLGADRRVEELRRQEERSRAQDLGVIEQFESEARRQRSLAMYLAAWSNAYIAELGDEPERAERALRQFGYLLNAPNGEPASIDRTPTSTLQYEHVARAALGAGVCESLRGRVSDGLAWLDLVDAASGVSDAVRLETFARRVTMLARANRWAEMRRAVADHRASRRGTPRLRPVEARLVAVLSLEASALSNRERITQRDLAELGLSDLLAQGQVGQVVEVARLFGPESIGGEGPRVERARGMIAYEEARSLHEREDPSRAEPPTNPEAAAKYAEAAEHLRRALDSEHVALEPAARASVELLLGLSLYHSGAATDERAGVERLLGAAERLTSAAERLDDPARAAQARLAAVRAAQAAVERSAGEEDVQERWRALARRFLDLHPGHEAAGSVLIRLAEVSEGGDPEEALATLLRVPRTDPAWESARRRAARLLYRMWREAPERRRSWSASRYVEVAEPLLMLDVGPAMRGDEQARARALVRGRRLLGATLSVTSVDPSGAARLLETVRALVEATDGRSASVEAELSYRAAQIALLQGDSGRAAALVERVVESDAQGGFAEAAKRLLFAHAVDRWREAARTRAPAPRVAERARSVVEQGVRLMERRRTGGAGVSLATLASTAEAAYDLWRIEGDASARTLSIALHRRLLEREPGARTALRRLGILSRAAGDSTTALEAWRTLLAGLPPGSKAWWEARVETLEILAEVDPDAARTALGQHDVLRPDEAPGEWRARMETLRRTLGVHREASGEDAP